MSDTPRHPVPPGNPNNPGKTSAEEVIFDANLQEFATRIGFIVGLEAQDKLSADAAYDEIKKLYKQLKASKKGLGIGGAANPPERDDPDAPQG